MGIVRAIFKATLTIMLAVSFAAIPQPSNAGDSRAMFSDYVDSAGGITLPSGYRDEWIHLGSITVSDESAPGAGFHDVYARPGDVSHYKKTGNFPDGAVIVKEIRKVVSEDMTTGRAEYAGDTAVWFVMIKDEKGRFEDNPNWGDGWGWALFKADDPSKNASGDYKTDCIPCHIPAKADDWVYIRAYPTIR